MACGLPSLPIKIVSPCSPWWVAFPFLCQFFCLPLCVSHPIPSTFLPSIMPFKSFSLYLLYTVVEKGTRAGGWNASLQPPPTDLLGMNTLFKHFMPSLTCVQTRKNKNMNGRKAAAQKK